MLSHTVLDGARLTNANLISSYAAGCSFKQAVMDDVQLGAVLRPGSAPASICIFGDLLAAGCATSLQLWNYQLGERVWERPDFASGCSFNQTGDRILSCSLDKVTISDAANGETQ